MIVLTLVIELVRAIRQSFRERAERGSVAIITAIVTMVVLIPMLALVFDYGAELTARRSLVQAADAGALAAASDCGLPATAGAAEGSSDRLAAENISKLAFDLQGGIIRTTGCGGLSGTVTVTYTARVPRYFSGILGLAPGLERASATASWTTTPASSGEPVVGNADHNGSPTGNTQGDPNAGAGSDCSHPGAGGPTPGGNVNHCSEPTTTVRLVG